MLITSPIISAGSGSIAGLTASRNRGGLYFRARAVPTNPNTTQQQAVRQALATLVDAWTTVLSPAQRAAWDVYAVNTPVFNRLGASIILTGQQFYIASNTPRIQASILRVDAAPTTFDRGSFSDPTFASVSAATGILTLAFTDTDAWVGEDDSFMAVYAGRPQNPSINYFKGPYRFANIVLGDATTPPTTPASIGLPFTFTAGQRAFFKVNVSRADGRYTQPFRGTVIVTA